jgi:hypothetical protein
MDMRNGREPRPEMISRVEHFMNNYKPETFASDAHAG